MLTIDDQAAYEVLLATLARLRDEECWTAGGYVRSQHSGSKRCMMGEIMQQMYLRSLMRAGVAFGHTSPLYVSINGWFVDVLQATHGPGSYQPVEDGFPERYNDAYGHTAVLGFLADRIDDLDQELRADQPVAVDVFMTISPKELRGVLRRYPTSGDQTCAPSRIPDCVS